MNWLNTTWRKPESLPSVVLRNPIWKHFQKRPQVVLWPILMTLRQTTLVMQRKLKNERLANRIWRSLQVVLKPNLFQFSFVVVLNTSSMKFVEPLMTQSVSFQLLGKMAQSSPVVAVSWLLFLETFVPLQKLLAVVNRWRLRHLPPLLRSFREPWQRMLAWTP